MAFYDLREFIERLKKTDDIIFIEEEMDWNLEIGAVIRRCNEKKGPATLFQKIKDYTSGYRILGGPLATYRRMAVALGLSPDASFSEMIDVYLERFRNPIKPNVVLTGPCKENILLGDEVDLLKFPVPVIHEGDGGRYIGTWHIVAVKDLDSDWANWGMYRLMVHDSKTMGGLMVPQQHIGMILNKYESLNRPMDIAVAIGTEPITSFIAASYIPKGVSEVDIIGGLRKEPLEIVKCETMDLFVPAASEIVIEGQVLPNTRKDEGPFGEYGGYMAGGRGPRPVIKVNAITYRNEPILTVSNMGTPVDDSDILTNITNSAELKYGLREAGLPITEVYIPPQSCSNMCVVGTKTPYSNIAKQIASFIWSHKSGFYIPRVIVVNDDVDPTDMDQVIFAFATKCHPERGTTVYKDMPGSPLTPFLSFQEREWFRCTNVLYDCTWPLDWKDEHIPKLASFKSIYPEELQKNVIKKLKKYNI
jgi:4-hydroxy-3-polyprenylbenzoate decarboxylase